MAISIYKTFVHRKVNAAGQIYLYVNQYVCAHGVYVCSLLPFGAA